MRLVTALVTAALLVTAPSATAAEVERELHHLVHEDASGRVSADDGRLSRGCQSHPYRYRVRAADSEWSLELFLEERGGRAVAHGYEWRGSDPARGRGRFRFCSRTTRPGGFVVRARLTWDDGHYHERWLEPRRIRLRR